MAAQHGVIARWQLLELGLSRRAIEHRIKTGKLHPVHRGVYAVGRRELTQDGKWMAAVLACGREAVLSHESAAGLWVIRRNLSVPIEISVPAQTNRRPAGIRVHRRCSLRPEEIATHRNIPLTSPIRTLVDLSSRLPANQLEAAVNQADMRDLVDPEALRSALDDYSGQPGVRKLRELLDRHTFRMTETEPERRFLRLVRRAGLPLPDTQQQIGGRVDFYWSELLLVAETDGWRYHRTPSQQAKDNRRMQDHAAAGRTAVRVSHYEIRFEPARVEAIVRRTIRRLAA